MNKMEKKKVFPLLHLKVQIFHHLPTFLIMSMVLTMNHKYIFLKLSEKSKFLIGEILQLLNFIK